MEVGREWLPSKHKTLGLILRTTSGREKATVVTGSPEEEDEEGVGLAG